MKFFFIAIGIVSATLFLPNTTNAQAPLPDITVSPAITEWVVKPGEKQTKTLRIINPKETPIPLRVVAEAMTVREKVAPEHQAIFDASRWFTISEPYFILKAKEIREVKVTLAMPKDAEPGGHYATIFFQQFVSTAEMQQTRVAGQVGALALISTQGQQYKRLEPDGPIRVEHKEDGSVAVGLTLHNTGNVHVLPAGKFIMKDWLGKTMATLPFSAGIVLPHTKRHYSVVWKQPPLVGYATIVAEVEYGERPDRLIPMPYSVWLLPGKWTVAFAILVPLLAWLIWKIRKRWARALKVLFSDNKT